jgi:hypothetical protein
MSLWSESKAMDRLPSLNEDGQVRLFLGALGCS